MATDVGAQPASVGRLFVCIQSAPYPRLRLFCFPYAGGSSVIFRRWSEHLPRDVELYAVEPPGRGTRHRERAEQRLIPLVNSMIEPMRALVDRPFLFFGHSMGGLLAFELARHLRRAGCRLPDHLFISATAAPHLTRPVHRPLHSMATDQFLAWLKSTNGTPRAVLDNEDLMAFLLPVIRADLEMCETYEYIPDAPLDCPITAFGGADDPEVRRPALDAWRAATTNTFAFRSFPGDHFFLKTAAADILHAMLNQPEQVAVEHSGAGGNAARNGIRVRW